MAALRERLQAAAAALATLDELVGQATPPPGDPRVIRDAAIQRFEYTFEAVWKAAQHFLREHEGLELASPKSVIRACREVGLLNEEQATHGLAMVDDRNLTVHTYNEKLARQIWNQLPHYAALMRQWLTAMEQRLS